MSKIKVQDQLTVIGDEKFLEVSFGELSGNLGMNVTLPLLPKLRKIIEGDERR